MRGIWDCDVDAIYCDFLSALQSLSMTLKRWEPALRAEAKKQAEAKAEVKAKNNAEVEGEEEKKPIVPLVI